ncbi:MAG: putative peptidase [uncultured bacterium]|nr:MAG: putative peptidase [uncultured bacterium]
MVKKVLLIILSSLVLIAFGWWGSDNYKNFLNTDTSLPSWTKPKPLEKYSIENLSKTKFKFSKINIDENIFDFQVDGKKVTGLINQPIANDQRPVVVLLRGYVDQSIYQTGMGTKRVGEYFANNGYITLAPDFLGYGGSDSESENIFESRFQTYTTTLTLIASVTKENFPTWDDKNIFIWAHSNGGQIALTVLTVTGKDYPTVLWTPVTEAFPYSVLYYTNESDDEGKFIRSKLAKFEEDYVVDEFSFTNYLDRINAPIEYHWGTADDAISSEWRDRFLKRMKKLEKDVTNYNHSGADHNMIMTSSAYHNMNPLWSEVILKTFQFFEKNKRT